MSRSLQVTSNSIPRPPASPEELAFFEQAKKFIGNKQTYNEFLKVLNLFSQEILDRRQLVDRVDAFIGGNKELFQWFKRFVRWDGSDEVVENTPLHPSGIDDVMTETRESELEKCKKYGPTYRLLPEKEQKATCSGRDELCYQILNDKWVTHPTCGSESSGFLQHRKNVYEETMYRCEEERYDFDMNIQANLDTIALLEPIQKRIELMSQDDRHRMTLPEGLGGSSKTIYKRVIHKIYGDAAPQVLEQLEQNPAVSVPLVLRRLRQKDEEWRRAQREYNRVWRELEFRNYYKALDRRSVNFKANEKRVLNPRLMIQEIEALQLERPIGVDLANRDHYVYYMADPKIHSDIRRIAENWCENQGCNAQNNGNVDTAIVLGFLDNFTQPFFEATSKQKDPISEIIEKSTLSFDNNSNEVRWMEIIEEKKKDKVVENPETNSIFANGAYYVLFRLYNVNW